MWLNTQYNSKMCFSTHLLEEKKITKLTSRYYNFLNKATFEEIFNLFRLKFFFYLFVFFCLWKCLWWRSNPVVNFFFWMSLACEEMFNFRWIGWLKNVSFENFASEKFGEERRRILPIEQSAKCEKWAQKTLKGR